MAWDYDEFGFPVYFDDSVDLGKNFVPEFDPANYFWATGEGPTVWDNDIPYYLQQPDAQAIDWMNMDWTNPQVQAAFGLTAEDLYDPTAASPGSAPIGSEEYPSTISDEGLVTLIEGGVRDFTGLDLTDEQIAAVRDHPELTAGTQKDAPGFWSRALTALGNAGSAIGNSLLNAAEKNPIAALTALAGGGAALAALLRPGPDKLKAPDFSASVPMSPEQRTLYNYIQDQAAREAMLGNLAAPAQAGILGAIQQQATGQYLPDEELGGVARQARGEQEAKNLALQNIIRDLGNPPDPMAYPAEYEQWLNNAMRAEELLGRALSEEALPGAYAQEEAARLRQKFEKRMLEAYGPGYTTSTPSVQEEYTRFEPALVDKLKTDAQRRKAEELAMYTAVSQPRFAQAENARHQAFGRQVGGTAAQLGMYSGLNETARTLGQLAAAAETATPRGAAERGLSALTGQSQWQQNLINTMNQFNAQQEAAKNAELWKFAGTALGGGLYSLGKTA